MSGTSVTSWGPRWGGLGPRSLGGHNPPLLLYPRCICLTGEAWVSSERVHFSGEKPPPPVSTCKSLGEKGCCPPFAQCRGWSQEAQWGGTPEAAAVPPPLALHPGFWNQCCHTVAFIPGAGAAGPDGKEALSWWAGQPSATLLSPQPFLMTTLRLCCKGHLQSGEQMCCWDYTNCSTGKNK